MFALDTNTVIHALKGKGRVRDRIERVHPDELAIPSVVAYELEMGTLHSSNPETRRRELNRLFSVVTILPFEKRAANRAAQLQYHLSQRGLSIGPLDTLIAGIVMAHGAVLVTHNTGEFSRVPGLLVEDWFV